MSSTLSPELLAKISALQRDFPSFNPTEIYSVLVAQNFELARARIQLALEKKQADQEKANKSQTEQNGDDTFESPFARASLPKDRASGPRISATQPLAPRIPTRTIVTLDEPLVAMSEYLSTPASPSSTPESTASSSDSVDPPNTCTSSSHQPTINNQRPGRTQGHGLGGSVFALSRLPPRHNLPPAPIVKAPLTIEELLKRGEEKKKEKERANRAKRKRNDDFCDDLDEIPMKPATSKRSELDVIELDQEEHHLPANTAPITSRSKAKKSAAPDPQTCPTASRLSLRSSSSGSISRTSTLMAHASQWKERFELRLSSSSSSSSSSSLTSSSDSNVLEIDSESSEGVMPRRRTYQHHQRVKDNLAIEEAAEDVDRYRKSAEEDEDEGEGCDGSSSTTATVGVDRSGGGGGGNNDSSSSKERCSHRTGPDASTMDATPIALATQPPPAAISFYKRALVKFGRIEEDG